MGGFIPKSGHKMYKILKDIHKHSILSHVSAIVLYHQGQYNLEVIYKRIKKTIKNLSTILKVYRSYRQQILIFFNCLPVGEVMYLDSMYYFTHFLFSHYFICNYLLAEDIPLCISQLHSVVTV